MNILIVSYAYLPSVGGIERTTHVLAQEFRALGHELTVVSHTPGPEAVEGVPTIRRPSVGAMLRLVKSHDVVFHFNISLRYGWMMPLLFPRKRWVLKHAGEPTYTGPTLASRLKHLAFKRATNVCPTDFMRRRLGIQAHLIPNPVNPLFRILPDNVRDLDCAMVARLVDQKGADIAIEVIARLRDRNRPTRLELIGSGPEEAALWKLVVDNGLTDLVTFHGAMEPEEMVPLLNRCRVLLVPSRYDEPFGVVALEGAACGLVVVGPTHGGLPEAIGPCGPTLPIRDIDGWADTVGRLLESEEERRPYLEAAPAHLERHRARRIAEAYLRVTAGGAP